MHKLANNIKLRWLIFSFENMIIKYLFLTVSVLIAATISEEQNPVHHEGKLGPTLPLTQLGNGFYYFENNIKGNWYQALEFCRNHDMYLLSVESKEENDLLVEYVEAQGFANEYWTSGNDLSVNNTYMWSSTGDRLTFTNWDQNSPSHEVNPTLGTEHCIEFRFVNGSWSWNDLPALAEIYLICEEICELCNKTEEKETKIDIGTVNPIVVLNGTQYYFEHNLRANWYEALDFCRAHDMQLLSIETVQEEVLILNHLNATVPGFANHWIAGTDLGVNNTWVWSSTGLRVIYENWATGQPSHMDLNGKTENAIYLGLVDGQIEWYDAHEYDLRYIICEKVCLQSCQGSVSP